MLDEAVEKTERMQVPCLHNENVPLLHKEKRCLMFKGVDDMSRLFTKKRGWCHGETKERERWEENGYHNIDG